MSESEPGARGGSFVSQEPRRLTLKVYKAPSLSSGSHRDRLHLTRALTVRSEAGVAGVAVEVGLVYGLIHHSCHPDGQVGGECEHETTPVWGGRSKRPVRVFGSFRVPGEVERGLGSYAGRRC